jgi:hypothetical protein
MAAGEKASKSAVNSPFPTTFEDQRLFDLRAARDSATRRFQSSRPAPNSLFSHKLGSGLKTGGGAGGEGAQRAPQEMPIISSWMASRNLASGRSAWLLTLKRVAFWLWRPPTLIS